MSFLYLLATLAVSVWAVIALVRGSVFVSTALFLFSTSCLPAEFFSLDVGGLTWTLDRLWFCALVAQAAVSWYRGEQLFYRLETIDVTIVMFFLWLTARTITQPLGASIPGQPHTLMHLINGYLIPFVVYGVLRTTKLDPKQLRWAFYITCVLGIYLSVTAFLEIAKLWGLVFPRFVGDPSLGIHFGRARGPMLQSVRLGICLVACWSAIMVFTVWVRPDCRFRWLFALASIPLMCGAVFLTYTRSVWMGLGLVISLLVVCCLEGLPRRAMVMCLIGGVVGVGVIKGPDLVAFKREYSAAETRESTYMRAAFAYVSLKMFRDKPVAGFGFNQFQVYNPPYLSDRSTEIRLESIRGYVHHNSYLSLLVDLGVVGLAMYMFFLLSAAQQAWRLYSKSTIPKWARGIGITTLAVGSVHMIQMAFHEVSFSSIENGFLLALVGLTVAANLQFPDGYSVDQLPGDSTGAS